LHVWEFVARVSHESIKVRFAGTSAEACGDTVANADEQDLAVRPWNLKRGRLNAGASRTTTDWQVEIEMDVRRRKGNQDAASNKNPSQATSS
jgi:hypothetical protein